MHDLGVACLIANRVLVMYQGAVVEEGFAADVFARPAHPYTIALTLSAPIPDPTRASATPLDRRHSFAACAAGARV